MIEITNENPLKGVSFALIDFWSPSCGPCRLMRPVLENLEKDYPEIKFFACNIVEGGALAQKYGVEMLPTILILLNGQVVYRNTGVIRSDGLVEKIEELLDSDYPE